MSAADFGTLIHRALELIDFKNPMPQLARAAAEVFKGLGSKKTEEAAGLLEGFFRSGLFKKMQSAKCLYKEIPFILNERHGRVDGVIDVLFQDAAGEWTIADYKTAVGNADRVKDSAYDFQMAVYGLAVRELLQKAPGQAELYFLKNQWAHTIKFSEEPLNAERERLRRLQQEILDYRAARTKCIAFPRER